MSEEDRNEYETQSSEDPQEGSETHDGDGDDLVASIKASRDQIQAEHSKARKEIKRLKTELRKKEYEKMDPDTIRAEVKTEYEEQLTEAERARAEIQQRYEQRESEYQLRQAADVLPVAPEGFRALVTYVRANHDVAVAEDGAVTIDGKPPQKFLEKFLESEDGKFFKRGKQNAGGGAQTPGQRPEGAGKQWSDMTTAEKARLFTSDPDGYKKLKEQQGAGTA